MTTDTQVYKVLIKHLTKATEYAYKQALAEIDDHDGRLKIARIYKALKLNKN